MKRLYCARIMFMLVGSVIVTLLPQPAIGSDSEGVWPIANAGLSRYAAYDPVVLDGTGSYDPDSSGPLSYAWQQIAGPTVVISGADTATPTISGFVQTDEIQECEFELIVNDGELTSLPDTVKVIVVPAFGSKLPVLKNDSFDPDKPTFIFFGGSGDCHTGGTVSARYFFDRDGWLPRVNAIEFPKGYDSDSVKSPPTYYRCGDMIIVYLSAVAPNYNQPIQISGLSAGGQTAIDAAIHLNLTYADPRYAVNRVTFFDVACRLSSSPQMGLSVEQFIVSAVDGEQCWVDNYSSTWPTFPPNALNVAFPGASHPMPCEWYNYSLTTKDMNKFNNGVVAGAYWSVVGPGKNLQLSSTLDTETYRFRWYGGETSGYMDFYNESLCPGRLPEPVTLIGPPDGSFVDTDGTVFSCEQSENAVGYQLLFGPDPHRVMDYYIVSDTPNPPDEVITSSPFEKTWWTVKAYDQYGSTIYADPKKWVVFEKLDPPLIENITTGQRYASFRHAINDARNRHEIVVSPGEHKGNINFKGKNLILRSTNPTDPATMKTTIIAGDGNNNLVTFSGGEDASCVLAGFTITGGKRGIYCSGSSPTITNCNVMMNGIADIGAGMYIENGSGPTIVNCTFSGNSASMMGGGIQNVDSSPIFINCTFAGNSAAYFGGGIYCAGGTPVLTNCILWGNTPDEISIFSGTPVITYSNIQGGFNGEGNINADPLFADPENGDFHLLTGSPCIDAGDPSTPIGLEPLPNGNIINMGAYGGTSEASKSP